MAPVRRNTEPACGNRKRSLLVGSDAPVEFIDLELEGFVTCGYRVEHFNAG
jgi:hypothetical protein